MVDAARLAGHVAQAKVQALRGVERLHVQAGGEAELVGVVQQPVHEAGAETAATQFAYECDIHQADFHSRLVRVEPSDASPVCFDHQQAEFDDTPSEHAVAVNLTAQIAKTRELVKGQDPEALSQAIDELSRQSYSVTEKLYAKLGGQNEEGA